MSLNPKPTCPLCQAGSNPFCRDTRREYLRCENCQLIHVPTRYWVSAEEEKAHYELHENNPQDARYRAFLSRLVEPLQQRLPPNSRGLDFGSGPGPTLSLIFAEAGHDMIIYDPFYFPDPSVLTGLYDFVTASEVVEHLHRPALELDRLWQLLRTGGWLGIMTKRAGGQAAFQKWHYKNDPTHVIFFSESTFRWLAERWQAELIFPAPDVTLFHKC